MKRSVLLMLIAFLPAFGAFGYAVDAGQAESKFYFEDETDARLATDPASSGWFTVANTVPGNTNLRSTGDSITFVATVSSVGKTVKDWGLSASADISQTDWKGVSSTNCTFFYESAYDKLNKVYLYLKLRYFRYNLAFETNGGSAVAGESGVCYTNAVPLAVPTRTGYTFDGWYTNATFSGAALAVSVTGETLAVPSDGATVTLYAKWPANQYTVTFDKNGDGAAVSPGSKSVTYDSTYGELPSPTWTGHTFDGWFTTASGGTHVQSSTTVSITSAQTLYAHWTAMKYSLTRDPNGGTQNGNAAAAVYADALTYGSTSWWDIGVPTRSGYTFNGWFTAASGGVMVYGADGRCVVGDYWTAEKRYCHDGERRHADPAIDGRVHHVRADALRALDKVGEHVHRDVRRKRRHAGHIVQDRHVRLDVRDSSHAHAHGVHVQRLVHRGVRRHAGPVVDGRGHHVRADAVCAVDGEEVLLDQEPERRHA